MMRKFFFRHLKHYFVILMIPSLLLLAAIFAVTLNTWSDSVRDSSAQSLDSMDRSLMHVYESTCTQKNMMLVNPQLTLSLRKIMMRSRTDYADYVFLQSIRSILMTAAAANPSVDSIYMYLDGYDNFLTSGEGVQPLGSYSDSGWYELYTSLPQQKNSTVIRRNLYGISSRPVFTVFERLTSARGVMVVNISADAFMDEMCGYMELPDSVLMIYDHDGKLIMCNSESAAGGLESLPQSGGSTQFSVRTDSRRRYLCTLLHDEKLDITFALLIPYSTLMSGVLSKLAAPLLLILVDCVVILLLAYYSARRNSLRIRNIMDIFGEAENSTLATAPLDPAQINTEYDMIADNIIRAYMKTALLDKQLAEEKYQKQAAEITALQLQINPHFLMNTLQTINFEVCRLTGSMQSPVSRMIDSLSDILRYCLKGISEPVTLREEIANVRKYVEIQNFRFQDMLSVTFDIDDSTLDLPFRRLLIQPLVENSISHGIRPARRKGNIIISVHRDEDSVVISCEDDGVGMSDERMKELTANLAAGDGRGCIGLNNVSRRLLLYYGEGSTLAIESREGAGTRVSFRIPADTNEEQTKRP